MVGLLYLANSRLSALGEELLLGLVGLHGEELQLLAHCRVVPSHDGLEVITPVLGAAIGRLCDTRFLGKAFGKYYDLE